MARSAFKSDPAPRVVSSGTVSRPKSHTRSPRYRLTAANATPKRVKSPQTIVVEE